MWPAQPTLAILCDNQSDAQHEQTLMMVLCEYLSSKTRLVSRIANECRQSGTRVPHYLRSVKTPDNNEEAVLSSHVNWSSRPISRNNTVKLSVENIFANPRERLLGVYATQDGNKDHMDVVAAAMQQGKVNKYDTTKASTRATIRGILSGIK